MTAPPTFGAALRFCREMRNPAFRRHLASIGHPMDGTEVQVLAVLPEQTIAELVQLVVANDVDGRALLLMEDDTEPYGLRLAWLDLPGASPAARRR